MTKKTTNIRSLYNHCLYTLGPGILMAGAAIGVSHLVQSTRAGADFGFQLLIFVLLANLFKYPFFEFGHRYAAVTGENLLTGYKKLNKWLLITFLILNIVIAIGSIAAVTFVTGALAENMLGTDFGVVTWTSIVMGVCIAILLFGHYHWLDIIIKLLMVVLFLATVTAFIGAIIHGSVATEDFIKPTAWSMATFPFIIALMGWMPGPIELSVWQSLWIEAKHNDTGHKLTLEEAKIDFNIGYIITVILAIMFLSLGALTMYGSGATFSDKGAVFASQVVNLYTNVMGSWAGPIIAIAAFTTMFSTSFTLIDAYPRSLSVGSKLLFPHLNYNERSIRWVITIIICGIALCVLFCYISSLKTLVDIVTTIAFLAAPLFAFLNFKLIFSKHTPKKTHPGKAMWVLSVLGLLYLTGFSILFIVKWFL